MIKINIINNNIMQDLVVVINKLTISQIKIIDITSKDIIQTLDFDIMVSNVFIVKMKGILGMIVLYEKKLLRKKRRIPNRKLE
jgi:hypothetical protein